MRIPWAPLTSHVGDAIRFCFPPWIIARILFSRQTGVRFSAGSRSATSTISAQISTENMGFWFFSRVDLPSCIMQVPWLVFSFLESLLSVTLLRVFPGRSAPRASNNIQCLAHYLISYWVIVYVVSALHLTHCLACWITTASIRVE
jgi:hypothetical protein